MRFEIQSIAATALLFVALTIPGTEGAAKPNTARSTANVSAPAVKRDWFRWPTKATLTTVKHIVIDPGHGGENQGAVGYWGTREKALTLTMARYFKEYIETNSNVRVSLTRHHDKALTLRARPRWANKIGTDAFISLHCNANENREARGMEVWFLSTDTSREVIHDLVRREERLPVASGKVKAPWTVEAIVSEMSYAMAHRRSSDFAHALASGLRWGRPKAKFRGVKQAPFGVLKEARMPAVVLEVGFISHAVEGKELLDPKTHLQLARGILRGLVLLDRKQVADTPAWKKRMQRRQLAKAKSARSAKSSASNKTTQRGTSLPGGPATNKLPK